MIYIVQTIYQLADSLEATNPYQVDPKIFKERTQRELTRDPGCRLKR